MYEPDTLMVVWQEESFRLEMYDAPDSGGRHYVAYRFFHEGRLIFEGADYSPGAAMAVDGDRSVRGLLGFLALAPGDTESDYFADYTAAQLEFANRHGKTLSMYADGDGPPLALDYGDGFPAAVREDWEVIQHGIETPSYFQGCGVSLTRYTYCATGVGNTESEALADALEMMAQGGECGETDWEQLERAILASTRWSKQPAYDKAEADGEDWDEWPQWYVSVRYNVDAARPTAWPALAVDHSSHS